MTDTAEEYYCSLDHFLRYVKEEVNPARLNAGLKEVDEDAARVCYIIINYYQKRWIKP